MTQPITEAHSQARESICDAALDLIKEGGIAAVSMRAIARRLNISAMMPYNYFDSKDELLLDMRLRLLDRFALYLSERLREPPAGTKINQLVRVYLAFGVDFPDEYRLMFDEWKFDDYQSLRDRYPADRFRNRRPWDIIRDQVSAALRCDDPHLVDTVTHLIWCQMHGLIALHLSRKLGFGMAISDLTSHTVAAIEAIIAFSAAGASPDP